MHSSFGLVYTISVRIISVPIGTICVPHIEQILSSADNVSTTTCLVGKFSNCSFSVGFFFRGFLGSGITSGSISSSGFSSSPSKVPFDLGTEWLCARLRSRKLLLQPCHFSLEIIILLLLLGNGFIQILMVVFSCDIKSLSSESWISLLLLPCFCSLFYYKQYTTKSAKN